MRYLGGKVRQASKIVDAVLRLREGRQCYREPFVGGGSVLEKMAPHFRDLAASDASPDLIALWRAVQKGWQPPANMDKATYEVLRQQTEPSALRAWAGFAASYNGKWFAGYGPTASGRDYLGESLRAIKRKAAAMDRVIFSHRDYAEVDVDKNTVVYCDPPYASTEGYQAVEVFDHVRFWQVMTGWARAGALVCVSEYAAPESWISVLDVSRVETMNWSSKSSGARVERLFVHESSRRAPR